jgi:CubicO group peptidase (beta-lactamase class C family)/D-alanyl-D-alanine dipeptidase
MNRLLALTLAAFVFVLTGSASVTRAESALPEEVVQKVEALITAEMKRQRIPGLSVAVAVDNQPVWSKGFGLADIENNTAATPDTIYRTASIAKPMTAVLALRLMELGRLDLDVPVQTYFPAFPQKQWPVTSRQLLGHLGGVRHYKHPFEAVGTRHYGSVESAISIFANDDLLHEPGTEFHYTTFGYNLLGVVTEKAGGADFVSLLAEHVFEPARMTSTQEDNQFAIIPGRTRGYAILDNGRAHRLKTNGHLQIGSLINAELHDTSMKIPGGGIVSTASDLVRLTSAINQGSLLKPETVQAMWTSQQTVGGSSTGYGLGWRVGELNGDKSVSHSGGQAGTSTYLMSLPEVGISVAVMSNLQGASLSKLAQALTTTVHQKKDPVTDYSDAISRLQAAVRYEVEQKQLPAFSISLVDDDQVVWADGFGFQDAEKRVPATAETVYRVGSVSKLFTDITMMQMVEQGQLDLDAPIQKYLPNLKPDNPFDIPITLRQMMSHRSGLVRESPVGNYFDPDEPSLTDTVNSLNSTSLVYKPETKTKYSNAAIAVVGSVLESQLDVSHAERVRQTILDPLNMSSSSFVVTPAVKDKLATAWMWTYDDRRFEAPTFLLGTGPAGNLYSSVLDLSKFLVCMFDEGRTADGALLKPETYRQMITPLKDADGKPQGFGIGFHIQDLDGYQKIGHGGAVYGFSTQLEALPERRLGVAAVSALDGSNGVVGRLSDYALRLMIAAQDGKPLPTYRTTVPVPADRAADLIGVYREADGSRFTRISELNGRVFMQRGSYRYELRATADDGSIITDDVVGFGTTVTLEDADRLNVGGTIFNRLPNEPPATVPQRWKGLIGEYGWDHNTLYILEDDGQLYALIEWFYYYPLKEVSENVFEFPDYGLYHGEGLKFTRNDTGTATEVVAAEVKFDRREVGTKDGETFKITPIRPIDDLRAEALAASPPAEPGDYREPELVELTSLDPTIKLDIRYASTNNFTGAVFYKQPRAFMQKPAAEAVVRANQRLKERGLGLLIHDAYRPWHVTKMFWDATPDDLKDFVANPANGSRHNRGCAVDLTLYDLKTGEPIQMVAGYDEFSPRSFPMYPGGTSRQRWYRELLRRTMEAEGFTIYEFEWWHFDYKDWKKYRIGNVTFEEILQDQD